MVWLGGEIYEIAGSRLLPVRARLTRESESSYVAESIDTGIFGSGDTVQAAVADLTSALREHYEVLNEDDALAAGLSDQLDFLRQHLRLP